MFVVCLFGVGFLWGVWRWMVRKKRGDSSAHDAAAAVVEIVCPQGRSDAAPIAVVAGQCEGRATTAALDACRRRYCAPPPARLQRAQAQARRQRIRKMAPRSLKIGQERRGGRTCFDGGAVTGSSVDGSWAQCELRACACCV